MNGLVTSTTDAGAALSSLYSALTPFGHAAAIASFSSAMISSGRWSGTSRVLIFTVARAGITVFAPSPMKPPRMPCTSNVGRAHTRSSTEKPGSPVSAGEPTSFCRYSSSLNGSERHAASSASRRRLHPFVKARDQHPPVAMLQRRQNLRDRHQHVRRRAAV